jgi:hypothetical protein
VKPNATGLPLYLDDAGSHRCHGARPFLWLRVRVLCTPSPGVTRVLDAFHVTRLGYPAVDAAPSSRRPGVDAVTEDALFGIGRLVRARLRRSQQSLVGAA